MRESGIRGDDDEQGPSTVPIRAGGPGQEGAAASGSRTGKAGAAGSPGGRAAQRRAARKKPKPLWRRILVWTSASLAFVVAAVAVAGYLYIRHLNNNIDKEELNLGNNNMGSSQPNEHGQTPLNILLLGSDSREGEENLELGGNADLVGGPIRADVQILMHVAADRSNATLISIPRDTQVDIPECTDPETGEVYPAAESESINIALTHGGPGCVVATWWELTGIPIDHFMMVDFAGVVDMADAVGGVPVCVDANVYDRKSGLRLPEGDNIVQGEQALQWLRTRQAFEDGGDTGRAKAQQMYLSALAEELQENATLSDPGQLMDLAEAATNALTVDTELGTVQDLYDLGQDLRSVPSDRINMITIPWLPDPENPNVTVIPDPVEAEELFALVREDIPLDDQDARPAEDGGDDEASGEEETPSPAAEIAVSVRNGTGADGLLPVEGRAGDITDELHRLGFTAATADTTPEAESATRLLYPAVEDQVNAEAVAEALGLPGSAVRISPSVEQITLVVGADWREGTAFPQEEEQPAGDDPSSGTGGEGEAATDDEPAVDEEDIISSRTENCMHVREGYTW